mmetsp:Transcript_7560/g.26613  ORF Transcript_7560/g.26613 Transcript_7560/m.26613 type:complete len:211 (-) Transcript_7560:1412-2044(-)
MSSTSSSDRLLLDWKWRMCRIGAHPAAAMLSPPGARSAYCSGLNRSRPASSGVPTASQMRCSAASVFIFMYGHEAHPPSMEHPSPPAGPGTTARPPSCPTPPSPPVGVTASDETGNTISTSTAGEPAGAARRWLCTPLTIAVTMPVSVPSTKRSRSDSWSLSSASSTRASTKSSMFCVLPTVPMPRARASMASLNISPGTSKCAVWYASP